MKSGFTLIEVLIATAISSILGASLFFVYYQTNRLVQSLTDYVDIYSTMMLVNQQMSKDIAGAFIPIQAVPPKPKKKVKPKEGPEPEEKEKKKPVLKDPFVSKNKGANMSLFSFITNNPMRVYWGAKTGEPKPSIARIVYTLQEDKAASKDKPRFILYRQEGKELRLAPYTKKGSAIQSYVLADNIKECKLTFVAGISKEDKPEEITYEEFADWHIGTNEKDVRTKVKVPEEVIMKLTLWDTELQHERSIEFTMPVAAPFSEPVEPEPLKGQKGESKGGQISKTKEILVTGANSIVQQIRSIFGT